MSKLTNINNILQQILAEKILDVVEDRDELTLSILGERWLAVAALLKNHPDLQFETLVDSCGVDYSTYANPSEKQAGYPRFAVVHHLLSVSRNQRLRVKVYAENDGFPVVPSVTDFWPSANWYEREAFDLFGIMFTGHPDLRRILTDYGFIGHPFRKDFPVSGYVEMRYDSEQGRVIYQPVTIEPREIVPRIVREEGYAAHE